MYLDKELSLSLVAKKLETNTKYLSEIIKKKYGKNFNRYINELRIYYLIELLKSDEKVLNYKIAYLAELCGFNSRNVFTTTFKSVVGESPSIFIEKLRKSDQENEKQGL
nr:AraC family transcriptional regulator [Carboxylicivirga linearis]